MKIEDLFIEFSNQIAQSLRKYKQEILGNEELAQLSLSQYYYLAKIKQLGNPSFSDLAKELNITKPSATVAVDKLIQQGYVNKVQSMEDKRLYNIYLSAKGEKLMNAEMRFYCDFAQNISSNLSGEELKQFTNLFSKIFELIPK